MRVDYQCTSETRHLTVEYSQGIQQPSYCFTVWSVIPRCLDLVREPTSVVRLSCIQLTYARPSAGFRTLQVDSSPSGYGRCARPAPKFPKTKLLVP